MIDRALLTAAVAGVGIAAFGFIRPGVYLLAATFLAGALIRWRGIPSRLLANRRRHVDVIVLTLFAVALTTLAAVLPQSR
jgi:hypothetical protein